MADIKFSCPHCEQHIQAEEAYAGMQINCPACSGSLVVPGVAPPPVPPPTVHVQRRAQSPAATSSCPSCGGALQRGAVLCTACGYNLATGQRLVAGRPTAPGKVAAPVGDTIWYKTPYPYVGGVLVLLGILYFVGRNNPVAMLAFLGVAALYSLAVHIGVLIAAFKVSIGTGFLALCIPFYAIYFVFKVCDNDTLKVLYGFALLINLALRFVLP